MSKAKGRNAAGRPIGNQPRLSRRELLATSAAGVVCGFPRLTAAAQGQLTWAAHLSLAPIWFDPAETSGTIAPFMVLYALHDALVKPMPGQLLAPSLAESWSAAKDGLAYDFVLREGVTFHNGEPVTADDVKFSFERYRGIAHEALKSHTASVDVLDPRHVRFRMKDAWPDFMTFYGCATGASWIVPRKYLEKVGNDGFKKAPIGAGPYKFVSFTPGIEMVAEAFDRYWRKTPNIKRLVIRSVPDESTRLASLKRGEVDGMYGIHGELANELLRTPGLALKVAHAAPEWLYFPEQWDPQSPWHDVRVRQAVSLAIDRDNINKAINVGKSRLTGNAFVPPHFEFYWQPPVPVYDLAKARELLATAGYPNGFDAGWLYASTPNADVCEAVINNLREVGVRVRLQPTERVAFNKSYSEKKFKNLIYGGSGAAGNAATRLAAFVVKGGAYAYGSYPDVDELFTKQSVELDHAKREAHLHKIQQLVHERVVAAPIWQLALLAGVEQRVGDAQIGGIEGYPWTSPYEDITLKAD
jgi:peptide/nickel transport system substrate-binding protein